MCSSFPFSAESDAFILALWDGEREFQFANILFSFKPISKEKGRRIRKGAKRQAGCATVEVSLLLFVDTFCSVFLRNLTCPLGFERCTCVMWWKWSWFSAFVLLLLLFPWLFQLLGWISFSWLFPVCSSCFCCCSIKNSCLILLSWGMCLCSGWFNLEKQNSPDIKERRDPLEQQLQNF